MEKGLKMEARKGRTKLFFYGSLTTAIYQVFLMLSGFIIPRLMLTAYGSELNGLVSSISQLISYITLIEAGLSASIIYALYKPLAVDDQKKINSILSAAKKGYFQIGYIFTLFVILLAAVYPIWKPSQYLPGEMVFLLVLALGFKGVIDFFSLARYRCLLSADQKTYVISIVSIVYQVLYVLIVVVLTALRANIVAVYWTAILAVSLRSLILGIYIKRQYPYVRYDEKPDTSALSKRWDALYQQLLGAAQNSVPIFIATVYCTLSQISVFTVYNMVISGVNGVMGIFISGLAASFGDVLAKKQQEVLERSYEVFIYAYSCINTFVYCISAIMIVDFVKIYTAGIKDENYVIPILGFLVAINGFLYNLKTPQGMLINSAGHYKETRVQCTIQGLLILVLGLVLAPKYKLSGILIASCMSNIYRCIDLIFYVPHRIVHQPIWKTLKNHLWSVSLFALIYASSFAVHISVTSIFEWILKAVIHSVIAVALTCVFSLLFYRQELKEMTVVLKRMMTR